MYFKNLYMLHYNKVNNIQHLEFAIKWGRYVVQVYFEDVNFTLFFLIELYHMSDGMRTKDSSFTYIILLHIIEQSYS